MAASHKTIEAVVEVILRHVDDKTFRAIMIDLKEIDGNASFRTTINRLLEKSIKKA